MKNKLIYLVVALMATFLITSCADVSHVQDCLKPTEHTYGFWSGTWHGMIMVFSFIGSLFSDDIAIYAVNNNGAWYDFGYIGGFWFLLKVISIFIKGLNN
jgi:hypothetical protein